MKKLTAAIFAIILTGCGTFDPATVGRNFGESYAAASRPVASNPVTQQVQNYGNLQPAKVTDQQCMSKCLSMKYQYGLCQANCSY